MKNIQSITATGLVSLLLATLQASRLNAQTQESTFDKIKEDKALLYVIRPKGPGMNIKLDVFANDMFLFRLEENSYSFAHLDPGRYWIWGVSVAREIEFVPGEAFYILSPTAGSTSLLSEEEGKATIEQIKKFAPQRPDLVSKKSKKGQKVYAKIMKAVEKVEHSDVEEVPVPPKPVNYADLVHVPAYSRVELKSMMAISSSQDSFGDTIWFEIAADAVVGGVTWARRGTQVKATITQIHHAHGFGGTGEFQLRMTAIPAVDGTFVPVVGQWLSGGRERPKAVNTAVALGGALGWALTKGQEAVEPVGTKIPIWTRGDVWIEPGSDTDSSGESADQEIPTFSANAAGPIVYYPEKSKTPKPIKILVAAEEDIFNLKLARVGSWKIPEPPRAIQLKKEKRGWACTFESWDLLRYLPLGSETQVRFEGTFRDSGAFAAEASLAWSLEKLENQ